MSLLSRLFGAKKTESPSAPSQEYQGFRITPTPMKEAGGYRLSAMIEKEVDGTLQQHHLIRADTISVFDDCVEAAVAKAKQMIDEQGTRIFR